MQAGRMRAPASRSTIFGYSPGDLRKRKKLAGTVKGKKKKVLLKRGKAAKKAKGRAYDIHTGKPTGREVQAMHLCNLSTG